MTDEISIDITIKPPESILTFCNDVIQKGVIHLLVPPSDLLAKWIEKDGIFRDEEQKKQAFKNYWKFNHELLSEDDSVREGSLQTWSRTQINVHSDQVLQEIAPFMRMFLLSVQEKVLTILLYQMINFFVVPKDAADMKNALSAADSIVESLSQLNPVNKAADLVPQISNLIFDLLISIKSDLESDTAKVVLDRLNEPENMEFSQIKNDLERRHRYAEVCIKEAHQRLVPVFVSQLDSIMEELCQYLRERVYTRVEEMLIQDRETISGPQHLE